MESECRRAGAPSLSRSDELSLWRGLVGLDPGETEETRGHTREYDWLDVMRGIARGGELTKAEVLEMVRRNGVPRIMGEYVAARLQAQDPPGKPREPWFAAGDRRIRAWNLAWDVALKEHRMREAGARTTRQRAIEETARENNITVRALRGLLRQEKEVHLKVLPGNIWPSRDLVARYLSDGAKLPGNAEPWPELLKRMRSGGCRDGYLLYWCGQGKEDPEAHPQSRC